MYEGSKPGGQGTGTGAGDGHHEGWCSVAKHTARTGKNMPSKSKRRRNEDYNCGWACCGILQLICQRRVIETGSTCQAIISHVALLWEGLLLLRFL